MIITKKIRAASECELVSALCDEIDEQRFRSKTLAQALLEYRTPKQVARILEIPVNQVLEFCRCNS